MNIMKYFAKTSWKRYQERQENDTKRHKERHGTVSSVPQALSMDSSTFLLITIFSEVKF